LIKSDGSAGGGPVGGADEPSSPAVVLPVVAGTTASGGSGLVAVVMEGHLHGVSTRQVDDPVKALSIDSGISKSEVSRICGGGDRDRGDQRRPP
jgi:hypothetical protein